MAETLTFEHPLAHPVATKAATSTTLVVESMHCGGCIRNVEAAIMTVPGVSSVRANLSMKRVTAVSAADVEPEARIRALGKKGFPASVLIEQRLTATPNDDLIKRLAVAGFAAANIMLLSVSVWSGHGTDMPASQQALFHWLSALIALPVVVYAGQPFFASARQALGGGRLNMDVPISLGVILATAMSFYQTLRGTTHVYFDAAVMLLFFLLIGRTLDQMMRRRAKGAAENLLGLTSTSATVMRADGTPGRIALADVHAGDRVLIAAGERVPVDARIIAGRASIDESLITGESRPREADTGDQIYAGTMALSGPFEAVATAAAANTLLADIARLMQTAEQARGNYVRLADRAASIYAPAVHVLGFSTFVGWMIAGQGWEQALTAAIAVLIITCPCALALAVPAVQVVATSRLFRRGVILKAADGLERLAEIDTVMLDKTGTLTLGEPRLAASPPVPDAILRKAASLAISSRHPYARAVVRAAADRALAATALPGVVEIAGSGLQAAIDGIAVKLGSARFCDVATADGSAATLWLKDGDQAAVALHFDDALRSDARIVVDRLKARGYAVELASGDRRAAVAEAAEATGIAEWRAQLTPQDKITRLAALKREGRHVLMVGDGLNDAPALATGHASLSPSTAIDISQNAADAVFQGEKLAPILAVLEVAKAARRRALQNFALAIGYNIVFVPLAMAGRVTPLIAALAMSASSIAVTANALRLGASREQQS